LPRLVDRAKREYMTVRQLAHCVGRCGRVAIVGTPTTIADHMEAPISDYCDDLSVGRTSLEVCVVGIRKRFATPNAR
jgi:hypothetical protein